MKNLILIGLCFVSFINYGSAATAECEKGEKKLDTKLKKLFWIGEDVTVPRTEADMEKFCFDISSIIKESTIFKNCLTPFPKLIVGIIGRQIKKLSKHICSSKQKRSESLSRLKCLNASNIHLFYNCTERSFVQLNYVSKHFNSEDTVAGFCCVITQTTQCTKASIATLRHSCKTSKQSPLDGILTGISGEAGDLICSKYRTPGTCEKEFGLQMKKLKEIADSNKVPFKNVPIVKPLLSLADKLSNKD